MSFNNLSGKSAQADQGFRARRISRASAYALRAWAEMLESRTYLTAETWVGGTGNWNVAANWSPAVVPGAGDDAIISAAASVVSVTDNQAPGTISSGANTTINITATGHLQARAGGTIAGTLNDSGILESGSNTPLNLAGTTTINGQMLGGAYGNSGSLALLTGFIFNGTTLANTGAITVRNGFNIVGTTVNNQPGGTFTVADAMGLNDSGIGSTINNAGTFVLDDGGGTSTLNPVISFQNLGGTINILSGTLSVTGPVALAGGSINPSSGAAISFDNPNGSNNGTAFFLSGTTTGAGAGHVLFNSKVATNRNPFPDGSAATDAVLNFPVGLGK